MKFSNFLFPESKTPEGDYDVIEESLREAELSEKLDSHDSLYEKERIGSV